MIPSYFVSFNVRIGAHPNVEPAPDTACHDDGTLVALGLQGSHGFFSYTSRTCCIHARARFDADMDSRTHAQVGVICLTDIIAKVGFGIYMLYAVVPADADGESESTTRLLTVSRCTPVLATRSYEWQRSSTA
jgi:hypothetical protein